MQRYFFFFSSRSIRILGERQDPAPANGVHLAVSCYYGRTDRR